MGDDFVFVVAVAGIIDFKLYGIVFSIPWKDLIKSNSIIVLLIDTTAHHRNGK
ncbi:hypothetical protein [Myroides odoratus]|uniref:hypothetical protein n=1 Tax=Myroides odoratus TaxID=256 RepID=UPI000A764A24|nr:hypothetical protein [Myroides odoratus]